MSKSAGQETIYRYSCTYMQRFKTDLSYNIHTGSPRAAQSVMHLNVGAHHVFEPAVWWLAECSRHNARQELQEGVDLVASCYIRSWKAGQTATALAQTYYVHKWRDSFILHDVYDLHVFENRSLDFPYQQNRHVMKSWSPNGFSSRPFLCGEKSAPTPWETQLLGWMTWRGFRWMQVKLALRRARHLEMSTIRLNWIKRS